jgi:suppressor of ftsI
MRMPVERDSDELKRGNVMMRRLFVFAAACLWLSGCGGRSAGSVGNVVPQAMPGMPSVQRDISGNDLPEPPEIDAVNGVATVSLVANINPATGFPSFEYNGARVAPTIRVKPGDTIVLDIANDLPAGRGRIALRQGELNIHFHGLGVSPMPPADDVLRTLAMPHGSLHYVVPIPLNQEPGLYWYHPHVHSEVNYQVGEAGMSGAIVVQGLEHHLPGLGKMTERLIVVRDLGLGSSLGLQNDDAATSGDAAMSGDGAMGDMGDDMPMGEATRSQITNHHPCGPDAGRLTVELNGAIRPVITIKPGAQQFFRIINATGHKTLKLSVDGESLEVVAIDGFALDSYPGTPPTVTVPYLVVPVAARAEFVVTGPVSGATKLRTLCYDTGPNGDPDPMVILADILAPANGHAVRSIAHPHPLVVGAPLPQNVYTTKLPPPAVKRTVVFSENPTPHFFINGKSFTIKGPPMFVVRAGTVEEWRVENTSKEIHDFHIHQIHFLVESINGKKIVHPHWADSVVIPHRMGADAKGPPGYVVMLMDFRDPIIRGEFVFHCHILDHEDQGMMAKIQAI